MIYIETAQLLTMLLLCAAVNRMRQRSEAVVREASSRDSSRGISAPQRPPRRSRRPILQSAFQQCRLVSVPGYHPPSTASDERSRTK